MSNVQQWDESNSLYLVAVHGSCSTWQGMSGNGPCPNNICLMAVHVQKMCVQGWFIDLLICIFINEVLMRSCSLNSEMILK